MLSEQEVEWYVDPATGDTYGHSHWILLPLVVRIRPPTPASPYLAAASVYAMCHTELGEDKHNDGDSTEPAMLQVDLGKINERSKDPEDNFGSLHCSNAS